MNNKLKLAKDEEIKTKSNLNINLLDWNQMCRHSFGQFRVTAGSSTNHKKNRRVTEELKDKKKGKQCSLFDKTREKLVYQTLI